MSKTRIGALVTGVTLVAGCVAPVWPAAAPATAQDIAPTIAVVGDSLIYQAEHGSTNDTTKHYLTNELNAAGWSAQVRAQSSADTNTLTTWTTWPSPPAAIVVALGSNDRRIVNGAPYVPIETSKTNVRGYLDRWPDAVPIFVGIVETAPRGLNITGPEWNTWVRTEATARGGVFVDWSTISKGHPEWFTSDLLHNTATGQAAYRVAIVAGAASSGIYLPPPTRPGPITNLRAAATTQTRIDWRWSAVPGATHYKVLVTIGTSSGTKTIVNTTTLGGRYLFTAGQPGKPYRIWVRAERTGVGTGPYASLVSRTNP